MITFEPFFETLENEWNQHEKYIKDWYYVNKPLSYKDFESIKEGSSWEDVKKIDPVTQIFKNMSDTNEKVSIGVTWHYLTDGILALYYDNEYFKEKGESIVSELAYWDDYNADIYIPSLAEPPYDAHVLDMDMLKK